LPNRLRYEINRLREPMKAGSILAAFAASRVSVQQGDRRRSLAVKIDVETLYNLEDNLLLFFTGTRHDRDLKDRTKTGT